MSTKDIYLIFAAILLALLSIVTYESWVPKKDIMTSIRNWVRYLLGLYFIQFIVLIFTVSPSTQSRIVSFLRNNGLSTQSNLLVFTSGHNTLFIIYVPIVIILLMGILIRYDREKNSTPAGNGKSANNIARYCEILSSHLIHLDTELDPKDNKFIHIEAAVDEQTGNKKIKKVIDMLKAVYNNKMTDVFLLLGEPGSGKSIALRKLSKELLQKASGTEVIPLYINLREWNIDKHNYDIIEKKWKVDNTGDLLKEFIVKNLNERGSSSDNTITREDYTELYKKGRLFFVLDSFDEIPSVLDVSETSWLIGSLSEIIFKYISDLNNRGIVASRFHRMPTYRPPKELNKIVTRLEILPLTDRMIKDYLNKYQTDNKLSTDLFSSRPDLVPAARNPFTLSLLVYYINEMKKLPDYQKDLYSNFVNMRITNCPRVKSLQLSEVNEYAAKIADAMVNRTEVGLEISIDDLKEKLAPAVVDKTKEAEITGLDKAISILVDSKLCRTGIDKNGMFSFVHRRFNEYFLMWSLLEGKSCLSDIEGKSCLSDPIKLIAEDINWARDALVLYCEAGNETEVSSIAIGCWKEIEKVTDEQSEPFSPQYIRAFNCLRFLKDAFINRPNCISTFQTKLTDFIMCLIESYRVDIISTKLAVEAVGLLKQKDLETAILMAMEFDSPLINDTALKACRHLTTISPALESRLIRYVYEIDIINYIYLFFKELTFSLNLSPALVKVRNHSILNIIDLSLFLAAIIGFAAYYHPESAVMFILVNLLLFGLYELEPSGIYRSHQLMLTIVSFSFNTARFCFALYYGMYMLVEGSYYSLFILVFTLPIKRMLVFGDKHNDRLSDSRKDKKKNDIKYIKHLSLCIAMSVIAEIIVSYLYLSKTYSVKLMNGYVFVLILIDGALLIPLVFIPECRRNKSRKRDKKRFDEIKGERNNTRKDISDSFCSFETSEYRLEYLKHLKNNNINPGKIINDDNPWPGGKIPNFDDEASTSLAKLEMKWNGWA
ncbi:MAG: NACHT domain-containing protein [Nitrospirae bacterium]|nr:NACHT domain-containing protein [Nitrospirota bacterium]